MENIIQQVRSNPNDIQARLVLADAWMEQGNPQGQLMAWKAQLGQMSVEDKGYQELESKCENLQKDLSDSFCKKYRIYSVEFKDGYVGSATMFNIETLKSLEQAMSNELSLLIRIIFVGLLKHNEVKDLAESPYLKNLTTLNLGGNSIGIEGVKALAKSPCLKNLTTFDFDYSSIGDEEAKVLAKSPCLKNLITLNLCGNNIGDEGVKTLAESPCLKNLTTLNLWNNSIGDEGAKLLAGSPYLKNCKVKIRI